MKSKGYPVAGIFSRFYDRYNSRFGFGEAFLEEIVDEAALKPGESVLDCGCGTGTLAIIAKHRVGPGGRVVGVDISDDQLTKARNKARAQGLEIEFHHGSIDELPCSDQSFDGIFSTLMFHHVPRNVKKHAFSEMRRVVKPDGRIVIADFGPPANLFTWILASPIVLVFLGGSTMRDNLFNRLPAMMCQAGLEVTGHRITKQVIHLITAV